MIDDYRQLGKTGLSVSAIGLGTYAIGGYWGDTDDDASRQTIQTAITHGVNFIDTADVYGLGKSETLIHDAIDTSSQTSSNIIIATKGGRDFYTDPPRITKNFSPDYLTYAFEQSSNRLPHINLYQRHNPSLTILADNAFQSFCHSLISQHKVRYIGISLNTLEEVREAITYDYIHTIQYPSNLLQPNHIEDVADICRTAGIGLIIKEPLCQGLLTGKYSLQSTFPANDHRAKKRSQDFLIPKLPILQKIQERTKKQNRELIHVSLQRLLHHAGVSTVIPGARSPTQLNDILGTLTAQPLSNKDIAHLHTIIGI